MFAYRLESIDIKNTLDGPIKTIHNNAHAATDDIA